LVGNALKAGFSKRSTAPTRPQEVTEASQLKLKYPPSPKSSKNKSHIIPSAHSNNSRPGPGELQSAANAVDQVTRPGLSLVRTLQCQKKEEFA